MSIETEIAGLNAQIKTTLELMTAWIMIEDYHGVMDLACDLQGYVRSLNILKRVSASSS